VFILTFKNNVSSQDFIYRDQFLDVYEVLKYHNSE